jgi:hypothetical protein
MIEALASCPAALLIVVIPSEVEESLDQFEMSRLRST